MAKRKIHLSKISLLHYWKLFFRGGLFLLSAAIYIDDRILAAKDGTIFLGFITRPYILGFIWVIFAAEMLLRFFPSQMESAGCQKVFAKNYLPAPVPTQPRDDRKATWAILAAWLGLNGAIAVLYFTHIIDAGILILISLAYSVCDMICILFFCPFQTWFLKNKCCGTCRIYNWDFAMMFTPLVLVPHPFTWSLFGLGMALVIHWEVTHYRHPERFYEETNCSLSCANCKERLCAHKKQLRSLHKRLRELKLMK
jgi:hypothetical protein